MDSMNRRVTRFRERGATAVEYAILVAAIASAIVIITFIVGGQIENAFNGVCQLISGINGAVGCS